MHFNYKYLYKGDYMTIVYPDEEITFPNNSEVNSKDIVITSAKSIISERVDFNPEIYIYIQKLMREENKTFNEIVNDLIRKHAEDSVAIKIKYVPTTPVPYTPQPYIHYDDKTHYYDPNNPKIYCDLSTNISRLGLQAFIPNCNVTSSNTSSIEDYYGQKNNNS